MEKLYSKYGYLLLILFLIGSLFDMRWAVAAIICMLAPVIFSIIGKGRYWCGNYCPRGNFYDNVLRKFSRGRKTPKILKSVWFRIFMVGLIMFNFAVGVTKNWGNLYGIGMVFYRIILITTAVAILLGMFFNERTWCRFCPMGSISAFIVKISGRKVNIEVDKSCVSCGLCSKTCPMEISPKDYKDGQVSDIDCILCSKCVNKCPKDSIIIVK